MICFFCFTPALIDKCNDDDFVSSDYRHPILPDWEMSDDLIEVPFQFFSSWKTQREFVARDPSGIEISVAPTHENNEASHRWYKSRRSIFMARHAPLKFNARINFIHVYILFPDGDHLVASHEYAAHGSRKQLALEPIPTFFYQQAIPLGLDWIMIQQASINSRLVQDDFVARDPSRIEYR